MEKRNNRRAIIFTVLAVILIVAVAMIIYSQMNKTPTKSYSELWSDIRAGKVQEITFQDSYKALVKVKEGDQESQYFVMVVSRTLGDEVKEYYEELAEADPANGAAILASQPKITLNNPNSGSGWTTFASIMTFVLIAALGIFLIISVRKGGAGGNAMNFGKTKTRVSTNVKVRFSDVAGAEEEKTELKEIVDFLKNPKKFTAIGAKIPRGVLLVGPPGTGKTLFAKAVAGEADVPFFSISGSDFVEMFVGVGASRVRDLFAQAKKNMPCIIFIDEIDAVGRQRGAGLGGGNDEREQTLNQLLVQMDGFESNDGIIVMAATNRADILDPALMRPGRFDRQIYVNIPDVKGREAIFKVHARNKPISSEVDFRNLARLTSGFSGADIANILNEAAILAARDNRKVILMRDITEGINKVVAGPQKKSRLITESDKRITAYHESGHAIVAKFMKYCDEVQEVSIIPRGMAAGYTLSIPKNDNNHISFNKLNDTIAMMLSGRAAEEIVIKDISTGASNDIKRASEIARKMVCEWGMSEKFPNMYFGGDQEVFIGRDYQTQTSYSEDSAAIIDEEIKKIIETNYKRAFDCLNEHRDIIDGMVRLLYEHETIYMDEVDMLVQGKSIEEINAAIEQKQQKRKEEDEKMQPKQKPIIKPVFEPADTIIVEEEGKDASSEQKPTEDTPAKSSEKSEVTEKTDEQDDSENKD